LTNISVATNSSVYQGASRSIVPINTGCGILVTDTSVRVWVNYLVGGVDFGGAIGEDLLAVDSTSTIVTGEEVRLANTGIIWASDLANIGWAGDGSFAKGVSVSISTTKECSVTATCISLIVDYLISRVDFCGAIEENCFAR